MCNKSTRSRNKHHILGAAQSTLSVIERIPAAVVDLMILDEKAFSFLRFGGENFCLLVFCRGGAVGPQGGDGCMSFREGCTRTSANTGICLDTTGRGDCPAPSAVLLAEL